eukprot:Gb_27986 [translate_table: standard]
MSLSILVAGQRRGVTTSNDEDALSHCISKGGGKDRGKKGHAEATTRDVIVDPRARFHGVGHGRERSSEARHHGVHRASQREKG